MQKNKTMKKEYVEPSILVAKVEMESLLAAESTEIGVSGEPAKDDMATNRFGFMEDEEE